MKAPRKPVQWVIVASLFGIGFLAIMVFAGGNDTTDHVPLGKWLLIKAVAATVVCVCCLLGRLLYKFGALPVMHIDLTKEEDL